MNAFTSESGSCSVAGDAGDASSAHTACLRILRPAFRLCLEKYGSWLRAALTALGARFATNRTSFTQFSLCCGGLDLTPKSH